MENIKMSKIRQFLVVKNLNCRFLIKTYFHFLIMNTRLFKFFLALLIFNAFAIGSNAQCTQTAPYIETFDSLAVPNCWTSAQATGDGWRFTGTPGYAAQFAGDFTGSGGAFAWVDFSGADDSVVLTLPSINVAALTTPGLTFSLFSFNNLTADVNKIYIEANLGAGWVAIDSLQGDLGGWADFQYDLTSFVSSSLVNLRFRAESGGGADDYNNDLLIDDVVVDEFRTSCFRPRLADTLFVGTDSAFVNWPAAVASTGNNFDVQYGASQFTIGSGTSIVVTNDTVAAITGLSSITEYDFYVRENCGATQSIWKGPYRFITKPTCIAPLGAAFSFAGSDSLQFDWNGFSGTSGNYNVEFGPSGFVQGTNVSNIQTVNNDTTFGAGNLPAGTVFDFYIREDCGGGDFSLWVGPFQINTAFVPTYFEGFDNIYPNIGHTEGVGQLNSSTVFTSTSSTWVNSASANVSGGEKAQINLYGTRYQWMFTPSIDLGDGTTTYQIDFTAFLTPWLGTATSTLDSDDTLAVVISTDNGLTWAKSNILIALTSASSISNGAGSSFSASLAGYSGLVKFGFYAASTGGSSDNDLYIDNVQVRIPPSCPVPQNLKTNYVGLDSVQVVWDSTYSDFIVEYGPVGFSPGTGTIVNVSDTVLAFGGLLSNTEYDVYLTTDCSVTSAGLSTPIGPISFNTLCAPLAVPFTETFNSTSFTKSCWTVLDANNDGDAWDLNNTSNTLNGDQNVAINTDFNAGANDDWLISPALSFTGNEQLAYYYRVQSVGEPNDFEVLVSTTGTNPADFQDTIVSFASYSNITYMRETVDMSAYSNAAYIAWHIPSGGLDGWRIFIDSVLVEPLPPCPAPSQLNASNISAFQADLSWTNPNATAWNIEVGPAGFGQGSGTVLGITSNPYTANSLTPNTCYDYYIQRDCGANGLSPWVGPFNFCTPPTCPAPTNLGVDPGSLTISAAGIYFTPGVASNFNIEYGATGFISGAGTSLQATNDTVLLTSLSSGTLYDFYVRDSCSATDTSTWTGPFTFLTAFNTNYLEDVNATTSGLPLTWFAADAILTNNTVLTQGFSSWGSAVFANSASTANTTRAFRANIWTTNQTEWAVSPSIYLDPANTNLQVEFDASVTDYLATAQGYLDADDSLALVISTNNGASWSKTNVLWAATSNDTVSATGEHIILPLTGYSGYVRFGIYGKSAVGAGADNDFFIDNFEVRTPRACTTPVLDSITSITINSATLYWTNGDVTGSSWDIVLTTGSQPASAGMVTTVTTSGSYGFTNLTDATSYCVYLVETCSNGVSDTAGPLCFTTACTAFPAPYFEDFEGSTAACWSNDALLGTKAWTVNNGSSGGSINAAYGGVLNARFTSSDGGPHITKLISPIIDASSLGAVQLSFYYGQEDWAGDQNSLTIYYRNTTSSPWVSIWSDSSNVSSWKGDTVAVPSNSSTLQIAFEGVDDYGRANVIDDVSIFDLSACVPPANLDTASIACDAASLIWVSNASSLSSIIEYGAAGFTLGAGTRTANATSPFAVTGLLPATSYEFYVRSVCAAPDSSTWSGPYAFTTDAPPVITATFTSNQTTTTLTSATVDFDASTSTGATAYAWDFGNGQTGTGVNASATYSKDSSYTVCLLITGACGAIDSTCNTIVVQGVSIEENTFKAVLTLFPNPSKGAFNLNVGNIKDRFDVEISDLSGRVIYRAIDLEPRENHLIDVTGEAAGLYMISIKGEGVLMNRRIIIEK